MSKVDTRDLADLIRRPIVTEKATRLMEDNHYTFEVALKATKPQIKAAIEYLFDVKVVGVSTQRPPQKRKSFGRSVGYRPQYKRAVVTLAPENSLREVFFPEV